MNFEDITIRSQITSRGGGIEISLDTLGYPSQKMTAYQNYLGGGLLGKIMNACTITGWINDPKLVEIAASLGQYFHDLTSPDESFDDVQRRPSSAY